MSCRFCSFNKFRQEAIDMLNDLALRKKSSGSDSKSVGANSAGGRSGLRSHKLVRDFSSSASQKEKDGPATLPRRRQEKNHENEIPVVNATAQNTSSAQNNREWKKETFFNLIFFTLFFIQDKILIIFILFFFTRRIEWRNFFKMFKWQNFFSVKKWKN